MIDCSIDINDLVYNHPEDVRSTFGISESDNFVILAPDDERGCIFMDNRIDGYNGNVNAYILISRGYVPSVLYTQDETDIPIEWAISPINTEYGIYYAEIKGYACSINTAIYVTTQRERFWVDVTICEGGEELGQITNGGRYVGYGDNITISAMPYGRNYITTWTEITDPEHPIPLPSDTSIDFSRTINNITSNRRFEACFSRQPKTYTFRLFTNDGKISNLNLERMAEGYKLGDVSVTFEVNGEEITVSTENSGYGVIKTYDFNTGTFGDIIYTSPSPHSLDRGVILYNVNETQELNVSAITYKSECCYIDCSDNDAVCENIRDNLCASMVECTSFNGWVNSLDLIPYNYNNLSNCDLIYPTFAWQQITRPQIDDEFIHPKDSLPTEALCNDYYYISTNNNYYSRSCINNDITLSDSCYTYMDSNEWDERFTSSFSNNITFYAVFKPKTAIINLKISSDISYKNAIGIIDYCFTYNYFEVQLSDIPETAIIMAMNDIPSVVDENSYEYIRVGSTYYQKRVYYRESGAVPRQSGEVKEIIGMKISLGVLGITDNTIRWEIEQNENDITQYFNGHSGCEGILPYECQELSFTMCENINFLAYNQ